MNRPMWILILGLIAYASSGMAETFTDALVAARKTNEAIVSSPEMVVLKKQAAEKWAKAKAIEARNRASKTRDRGAWQAYDIARRESEKLDETIRRKTYHPADQLSLKFPVEVDWLAQTQKRPGMDREGRPIGVLRYLDSSKPPDFIVPATLAAIQELSASSPAAKSLKARYEKLQSGKTPYDSPAWVTLFVDACTARRSERLKGLVAKHPRFLFIKRDLIKPSFYAYTEGLSDGYNEKHFPRNSALCMLDLSSGKPVVTTLLEDKTGSIRDLDISFDGKRALFAWKKGPRITDDDYHLYEMDLATKKIRQITSDKHVADYEGRYLPSGDILFVSSRCTQAVDCWKTDVSNLYVCDTNGKRLRRLGFDQVHTTYPTVMNDGKILYTRWDYNDRGQLFPQPLFQMNPDGTQQTEYYGNNSFFPTVTHHARTIPGSSKVLAVLHGHHSWQAGKLAIIDRTKGTQEAAGVQLVAPQRHTRAVRVDGYGQDEELFRHPFPLNEEEYIVAMTPYWNARHSNAPSSKFGLYYIRRDGTRELLAYDPQISAAHPIAIEPRTLPIRPSAVDYTQSEGTYFLQDVYVGPGLKGVPRGSIKKLRVVALDFRAAPIGNTSSHGKAGGSYNSTPVACGNATWDPKIILGEAKVYPDGSAMFRVPAHTPVYFQCIDEKGQVAATMRSWSTLMPGETFGCVGCHEDKNDAPPLAAATMVAKKGAQALTPFHHIRGGFSFAKHVQPILDKHCISCHNGKKTHKGKPLMDLTDTPIHSKQARRNWSTAYVNLTGMSLGQGNVGKDARRLLNWISSQSVPTMLPPYSNGSAKSKIVEMMRKGHGKTKLTPAELEIFCAWIDLAVPFCGDYVEANTWNKREFARYMYYQRKRERLAADVRRGTEAWYKSQTGKTLKLADPAPRYLDEVAEREAKNPKKLKK